MDKQTDLVEANHRVGRSSFIKLIMTLLKSSSQMLNSGPTNVCKKEISVEWRNYIANIHATPGKNPTLYKTHKTGVPVSLLTSGCNTAIENLSRFIKVICSPLTEIMQCRIKDTCIYNWYFKWTPNIKSCEVSVPRYCFLDMFPCIENQRGIQGIQDILVL